MLKIPRTRQDRSGQFLIGGFLLLVLVVTMSVWFSARWRADAAAAQATLLTKDQLANMLSVARQAESSQRGYLLTGKPSYLRPYGQAVAAMPSQLQALASSMENGPNAANFISIKQLVTAKFAELARTVALYQGGDKAASLALVNTDVGDRTMGALRDLIRTIQADETQRLQAGRAEDARDGWILQAVTALAVFAALLLAFFAIRDNRLQTNQLRAAEAALTEANAVLERKVEERTRTLRASEAALAEANASLELRVAERARELDRIFRLSTDILAVGDREGRFFSVSPAWERVTGHTVQDILARPYHDFVHPEDVEKTQAAIAGLSGGVAAAFENRYRRADGSWCWLAWRAVPLLDEGLIYCIARDITADRERDEQLRQSQKMEVVGQLTGGVAHDFNNLLTIIMGSLELLRRGLKDGDARLLRRLDDAMEGARRAAALTHRLLAFSRRQPLAPKATDVNRLIAGMSDMLYRTLGEAVSVEVVAGAGLWAALADANQLESSLLNLAINGRDAMPQGGRLTIETQNMYLDDVYAAANAELQPGQYVQIAVTDTGTGMTPEIRAKAFEPFFTTKPPGQGTGLGLAQVYGFIKQSGGHITIYSERGQGTTIKLYLPRLRGTAAAVSEGKAAVPTQAAGTRGRGETILLVEDEEGVRKFSAEVLKDLGYTVLAVENAAGALEVFNATPDIRMLFTDIVLTGPMDGRVLADTITQRRPDVVVLFTTGYTRNAIIHNGKLDDGINFIGKPFTAPELALKIRQLLDAAKPKIAEARSLPAPAEGGS